MVKGELRNGWRWPWVAVTLIVLAGALWSGGAVHAQDEGNVNIEMSVDWPGRSEGVDLTVGHPVTITLEATHPDTSRIIFPTLKRQWDEVFEVDSQSPATTTERTGRLVTSQTIKVILFAPGEHEVPPLVVEVQDSAGTILDQPVPTLALNVVPVLPADVDELEDIRPQAEMTGPPLDLDLGAPSNLPWIVGALALIGLACWWLYKLLRPRPPEPVFISPYDAAMGELERIEGLRLPAAGRFKEHYTLVADAIRSYLEGEFGIPALDRTTSEIQAEVNAADIDADGATEMRWLFVDCDIVKFTGLEPDEYEAGLMVGRAREILDTIRPAEAPAEPEGPEQLAEAAGA